VTIRLVTISTRLGAAFDSGVPVLVLVSMGPVAALVGPPSVLVWAVSASVGLLMALIFADLASGYPRLNGGVAVLAARVLRRQPALARIGQWSYWLGWSPALAINGLLVGSYLQRLALPDAPRWTAVLLATAVLAASVAVNHYGLRVGGRMQAGLLICVAVPVGLLFLGALVRGNVDLSRLGAFSPPGGWTSASGWLALSGGLFIAGWSAYGAELSLAYPTRYHNGVRDALQVTGFVALASVAAFAIVPFLLIAIVGVDGVRQDPADAFHELSVRSVGSASGLVLGVLTIALVLGLNMIAIASSWTLCQMARGGDAWARLAKLNRHGVPGNALRFDLAVNVGLLLVITVLTGGDTAEIPIALLAASNVAYLVSMCVALAAAWHNHRTASVRGLIRLRPGLMGLAPLLIGFNIILLATAGFAWGWRNVAIGAAVLSAAVLVATWRTGRVRTPVPTAGLPACWGRAGATEVVGNFQGRQRQQGAGGTYGHTWSNPVSTGSPPDTRAADLPRTAGPAACRGG
jgi:amino acid transporter